LKSVSFTWRAWGEGGWKGKGKYGERGYYLLGPRTETRFGRKRNWIGISGEMKGEEAKKGREDDLCNYSSGGGKTRHFVAKEREKHVPTEVSIGGESRVKNRSTENCVQLFTQEGRVRRRSITTEEKSRLFS